MTPPVILLRSDSQKLGLLTRCHEAYVGWLRDALRGEATLELLVDVSTLVSHEAASSGEYDAAAHRRLTERAAAALQRTLGVPSFAYTVEQIWAAFAAVHHWPSPEAHETKRNVLSGDVIRGWWQHVTRKYTPLLGTNAARRLTSYLIHEPSLVLAPLPSHVWVLEDDAVFVGDVSRFFRSYRAAAAPQPDYLSVFANLRGNLEASSHDWKTNAAFERLYGSRRVHKWEHLERFSSTLILRLDELLGTGGVAAHGEMFASTVCLAEPWCLAADIRLSGAVTHDASLYGLSASVFTISTRWEREALHRKHVALGAPGVWMHSVKNYCNALALASNGTARAPTDNPVVAFVLEDLGALMREAPAQEASRAAAEQQVPAACGEPLDEARPFSRAQPVEKLPFSGSEFCRLHEGA